jgi:hypothetical protein
MFQIFVPDQEIQGKYIGDVFLNFFLNANFDDYEHQNT